MCVYPPQTHVHRMLPINSNSHHISYHRHLSYIHHIISPTSVLHSPYHFTNIFTNHVHESKKKKKTSIQCQLNNSTRSHNIISTTSPQSVLNVSLPLSLLTRLLSSSPPSSSLSLLSSSSSSPRPVLFVGTRHWW